MSKKGEAGMIYAENLKVYCNHGISDILDMELTAREGEHGRLTLRGRIADGGSMPDRPREVPFS